MLIVSMTREYANDIAEWVYDPPYEIYSMASTDPEFRLQQTNGFVALVDGGVLIGYRSFGIDGQVPGFDYDDRALDTGGGLRPSLTGRGLGREATHRPGVWHRAISPGCVPSHSRIVQHAGHAGRHLARLPAPSPVRCLH